MGGVTTVIDFADHLPGLTLSQCAALRLEEAAPQAAVDYTVHQNVTRVRPGIERQLSDLRESGIASVKVFTTYRDAGYMLDPADLAALFRAARSSQILVTVHAEDDAAISAARQDLESSGRTAPQYHPWSRPARAEAAAVQQVLGVACSAGGAVYFVHISTGRAALEIIQARERGCAAYMETCPHYLLLGEDRYTGNHPGLYIMSPPLRTPLDRATLWGAVLGGHVDVIATDHCAYTVAQKSQATSCFDTLPGIPGVQALLPLLYTYGVCVGKLSLPDLARMLSSNPAKLFGLFPRKGEIAPGADADIVLYDPAGTNVIRGEALASAAGYSPFDGMEVRGRVNRVFLRGTTVAHRGEFTGSPGRGEFARTAVT
jgi:dihydropyrimidinase